MDSTLSLPTPDRLPSSRQALAKALRAAGIGDRVWSDFAKPSSRAVLARRARRLLEESHAADERPEEEERGHRLAPLTAAARAEQLEHDRYFAVSRVGGEAETAFVAGLVLAYLSAYENAATMGVTLLGESDWTLLFHGLQALIAFADGESPTRDRSAAAPPMVAPQWTDGYDPATRWLIGHQLFFALIQGSIVGLNCYASARLAGSAGEAELGLRLTAAFMHSSASAMRFTSDFAAEDYEATVRPAMSPPLVRAGFSGLQTRDHAHLVRLFGALRPMFSAGEPDAAHEDFVESVVAAYAAHEFICARFRGDVLPSLRMAATTRGATTRSGVDVIRDMMRARLRLVDPENGDTEPLGGSRLEAAAGHLLS
jgi:hypothetical protein